MSTNNTQGLPHVAAVTAAEIAAAAIAPFVHKRVASLTRSREACEAELKIVSGFRGFEDRVKYLESRIRENRNHTAYDATTYGAYPVDNSNQDRKSTRLNSSHITRSRMPSSA